MWLSSLFGNIASMRSFQLGIIVLCGLIFNNCGNITIHQLGTKNLQNLQQIAVKDASGREGQLYGRELRKLLHIGGKAVENYELISSISFSSSSTLSVQGASSTLKKMTMSASFKLRNLTNGETLIADSITADATLGAVTSLYGQDKSETHARKRLAILLAQRVVQRLQLYFLNQNQ
ncbi:MAG: LPS assembly lipoprotein LptE [Candidatus Puniceispirillaceae bacterium]